MATVILSVGCGREAVRVVRVVWSLTTLDKVVGLLRLLRLFAEKQPLGEINNLRTQKNDVQGCLVVGLFIKFD